MEKQIVTVTISFELWCRLLEAYRRLTDGSIPKSHWQISLDYDSRYHSHTPEAATAIAENDSFSDKDELMEGFHLFEKEL